MVSSPRNSAWRTEWRADMPRADSRRPTDAMLAAAESAFMDPERSLVDRKFAALKGVPTPVANESCFPMWIPAKALTSTFSDTEIMTSLGSGQQPLVWCASVVHLRDFKCIKNGGVSFVCTDREICTKLGNLKVTICGRNFTVQPYSKYSHWYYIDLQRMPDDVTDGDIYDWFVDQGTPPVYLTPAHEANGLKSRTRRVYFNQKAPPTSLMIGGRVPLRQIQFTQSGYCVVNHRIRAYNKEVPPFLAERRGSTRPARKAGAPSNPRARREIDLSDNPTGTPGLLEQPAPDNDPPMPDGDESMGATSNDNAPPVSEAAPVVRVRPEAIWTQVGSPPTFKLPEATPLTTVHGRISRCKQLLFLD